jgi:hypothetical protein
VERVGTDGVVYNEVDHFRKNDAVFDVTSPVGLLLKQRLFSLAGVHPYIESFAEGFHVSFFFYQQGCLVLLLSLLTLYSFYILCILRLN